MANIFLDCGGFTGSSIARFKQMPEYVGGWKLYSFEPNPRYLQHYAKLPDVTHIKAACWTFDGELEFQLNPRNRGQAGHIKLVNTDDLTKDILKVQCLDFATWVLDNTTASDNIVLKMDIEGSEYGVLEHMLAKGVFSRIGRTYIEWHRCRQAMWRKINNGNEARADNILAGMVKQNPGIIIMSNLENELSKLNGQ
jgi:FkbM family methyltransferase